MSSGIGGCCAFRPSGHGRRSHPEPPAISLFPMTVEHSTESRLLMFAAHSGITKIQKSVKAVQAPGRSASYFHVPK
jgi:hypothetical protein